MPFTGRDSAEEKLFAVIGGYGPWQMIVFAIFFYSNILGIWQSFAMTFLAPKMPFRCVHPNVSHSGESWPGQCSVQLDHPSTDGGNWTETVPCTEWEYDTSKYSDTLVSEWDLVCDREWLISLGKSVYMIGFLASVFVFGQVSDWVGRFPTIVLSFVIYIVGLTLCLFSPTMEAFLLFRFLQAFGRTGVTCTGYVLVMEMVGSCHRTHLALAIQLGWSTGLCTLALVGYFFRDWFWFQMVISLPALPLLLTYRLIPESPRWLMTHKRLAPLRKMMKVAARRNGRNLKEDSDDILQMPVKATSQNKGTLLDLFRTPGIRANVFNMMYLWMVNGFIYYALSYNTNDLLGDSDLNFLLIGLIEFPAYGLLFLASTRFGRRPILVALMLACGASCIALVTVPNDMPWLSTTLSLCGKFCVTASFGLLYLYTGELFPTVVRSVALGTCSTVARLGSIVAPFSSDLNKASHPSVTNILNFLLAVSSGLGALWLPETRDQKLPDTLEEGEFRGVSGRSRTFNEKLDIA